METPNMGDASSERFRIECYKSRMRFIPFLGYFAQVKENAAIWYSTSETQISWFFLFRP
jgi:hypothetical protein